MSAAELSLTTGPNTHPAQTNNQVGNLGPCSVSTTTEQCKFCKKMRIIFPLVMLTIGAAVGFALGVGLIGRFAKGRVTLAQAGGIGAGILAPITAIAAYVRVRQVGKMIHQNKQPVVQPTNGGPMVTSNTNFVGPNE